MRERNARNAASAFRVRRRAPATGNCRSSRSRGRNGCPRRTASARSVRRQAFSSGVSTRLPGPAAALIVQAEPLRPLTMTRAQLAAAVRREIRMVAEMRNIDARRQRRLQDGLARLERNRRPRRCVNRRVGPRSCLGSQMGGRVVAPGDLARAGSARRRDRMRARNRSRDQTPLESGAELRSGVANRDCRPSGRARNGWCAA